MAFTNINGRLQGIYSASDLQNQIDALKAQKQDILINQANIKSINNVSLIGSGDIDISQWFDVEAVYVTNIILPKARSAYNENGSYEYVFPDSFQMSRYDGVICQPYYANNTVLDARRNYKFYNKIGLFLLETRISRKSIVFNRDMSVETTEAEEAECNGELPMTVYFLRNNN